MKISVLLILVLLLIAVTCSAAPQTLDNRELSNTSTDIGNKIDYVPLNGEQKIQLSPLKVIRIRKLLQAARKSLGIFPETIEIQVRDMIDNILELIKNY